MRKRFVTTLERELVISLKKEAIDRETFVNVILEELITEYFDKKKNTPSKKAV